MEFIPYNSSLTYHKYPFGAVEEGTEVTFRIVLPKSFECGGGFLHIAKEGDSVREIPLSWERDEGSGEEWWAVRFTPASPGLYFYRFRIYNYYSENFITRAFAHSGRISSDGEDFFFTVYEKGFSTPEHIKGGVIYQIFPDRFCFSGEEKIIADEDRILRDDWGGEPLWQPDSDGRITKYDFFKGDLKGIESKLGYLSELGINCIYLNPVFYARSNHRYDTADYEMIDPLLGSEEDFASLCRSAHKLGIKIILDGVFSHTGSDSKYFNKDGRFGKGGAYNSKKSPYYSWYKFSEYPDLYDCWWGVDILPEVDENNAGYIKYIGKVLKKWQTLGADGWRLDVADELPDKFLDALRKTVKGADKDAFILGEVWEDASCKISYGERRRYLQGKQLDSVMNYPFADALVWFAVSGVAEGFNDRISEICENYPKCVVDCLMNHIGTHDTCRILNRLGTLDGYASDAINRYKGEMTPEEERLGKRLLRMITCMQFTLPGVPCIYYGDEVGAKGGVDPFNRGCYPYGKEDTDLLEHYRFLCTLRKEHPAFKDGVFVPVSSCLGCVAYERRGGGEGVITVANRNPHPITYTLPADGYISLTGQTVNGRDLCLGAEEAAILFRECD